MPDSGRPHGFGGPAMTLDPTAFDALYAAQADRLYRSALGIVRDPDAAADVVEEAFVRAYTADDEISFRAAWLATVARHLALNELRRRSRLTGIAEDATDDEEPGGVTLVEGAVWTDPAKSAASADSVAGVAACLAELLPDDRSILTFRYGEGLEISAIAELLGRTVDATTMALHRARARIDATYADRVFARASVPAPCRPWRADAVGHADGKSAAPEYATDGFRAVHVSWTGNAGGYDVPSSQLAGQTALGLEMTGTVSFDESTPADGPNRIVVRAFGSTDVGSGWLFSIR